MAQYQAERASAPASSTRKVPAREAAAGFMGEVAQRLRSVLVTAPDYEALQLKVQLMEQENQKQDSATQLLNQIASAGLIRDDGDGQFTVHGSHGDRQFSAFDRQ